MSDASVCKGGGSLLQEWLCRTLLFLLIYGQTASIFWMSVEGGYLISRFTIFAMRNSEGPLYVYILVGWGERCGKTAVIKRSHSLSGLPFLPSGAWAIYHHLWMNDNLPDSYCWIPILKSPAMTILTVALGSALVVDSTSKGFVLKELPYS